MHAARVTYPAHASHFACAAAPPCRNALHPSSLTASAPFAPQGSKCFILALDSLGWDATESVDTAERYLLEYLNQTRPVDNKLNDLSTHVIKVKVTVPNQGNGFDCGLHTCEYIGKIAQRLDADRMGILQRLHDGCDTFEAIFGVAGNTVAEISEKRREYEQWLSGKHSRKSDAWESFGDEVPTPAQLKRMSETPASICEYPEAPADNRIMLTEKELAILHPHTNDDEANYLNDELMNVILLRMTTPLADGGLGAIGQNAHVFSTHFLTKLAEKGIDGVKRWTNAVEDLFGKYVLFIPSNAKKIHWLPLAIVNPAALKGLMGDEKSEDESKDTDVGDREQVDLMSEDEMEVEKGMHRAQGEAARGHKREAPQQVESLHGKTQLAERIAKNIPEGATARVVQRLTKKCSSETLSLLLNDLGIWDDQGDPAAAIAADLHDTTAYVDGDDSEGGQEEDSDDGEEAVEEGELGADELSTYDTIMKLLHSEIMRLSSEEPERVQERHTLELRLCTMQRLRDGDAQQLQAPAPDEESMETDEESEGGGGSGADSTGGAPLGIEGGADGGRAGGDRGAAVPLAAAAVAVPTTSQVDPPRLARHALHATPCMSCRTHHALRATPYASRLARHALRVMPYASRLARHTARIGIRMTPYTPHVA